MKAHHRRTFVGLVVMVILLAALGGCQQPAAEAPVENASVAVETVLAEGETVCELTILDETSDAALEHTEPELGRVVRGHLIWGDMNCPGSFDKARVIALQDFWDFDPQTGDAGVWIGYNEIAPEAGGTWKGQCEVIEGVSNCVLEGDGVNEGKRLETAFDFENSTQKYRILQVPQAAIAAYPAVTETGLAEGETICELTILDETSDAALEHTEPGLGRVVRGHIIWADMNCPGAFDNARVIAVQDFWDFDPETGEAGVWIGYNEIIPEAGGTWKGQCENIEGVSYCTLEGDGVNAGKRLETALNFENLTNKYRILQVP